MLDRRLFLLWVLYVALIGFVVGASFDSAFFAPQQHGSTNEQDAASKNQTLEERQEAINESVADSTKWMMRYTGALVIATLGLGLATIGLYIAGQNQFRLARAEFLSSNRPKLRLKHIWLATPDGARFLGGIVPSAPITARLDIVNIGSTIAYIGAINFVALVVPREQRLPQRPPYNDKSSTAHKFEINPPFALPPGRTFTHPVFGQAATLNDLNQISWNHSRLYLIGTIEYWDGDEPPKLRQTAFCRYLTYGTYPPVSADNGRFEIARDPDYEYED